MLQAATFKPGTVHFATEAGDIPELEKIVKMVRCWWAANLGLVWAGVGVGQQMWLTETSQAGLQHVTWRPVEQLSLAAHPA